MTTEKKDLPIEILCDDHDCLGLNECPKCAPGVSPTDHHPVAEIRRENDYMSRGHFYEGSRKEVKIIRDIQNLPLGTKLYVRTPPAPDTRNDTHSFQNFHRALCERFGYAHDANDWRRDQVSLIEHIAKLAAQPETPILQCAQCKKSYRKPVEGVGCPKCAPGVVIDEDEFQKPITKRTESLAEWVARATPAELNAANWRVVYQGLLRARTELEATGVRHSWIGPYLDIAKQEGELVPQPKCLTCNDHGMIGGLLPGDGGYDGQDCPDCNPAQPETAAVAVPSDLAQLRHLYSNLINGGVRDTASAKRIATGLLGPVIERLEKAAPTTQAPQPQDALRCAVGNCKFNGEVAEHAPGCPNAPQPVEPAVSQGEAELPDSIRVPLDSLHADAEYLVYRADQGHLTKARIVGTIRERVDAAKAGIRTALATRPQEAAPSQDAEDAEDAEDAARFRSFAAAALTQEDSYLDAIESGDFDEPKTLDDIRALFDRAARTQEKNNG